MAGDFTCEVKGLSELQEALEELPKKIADKGLRSSLKLGAAPVKQGMVSLAPKDTGFLSENFGVRVKISRDGVSGSAFIGPQGKVDYPAFLSGAYRIVRNAAGKAKKRGKIAVATIARFLEFGTSKRSKHPFMTQAFESNKDEALQGIVAGLTDAVNAAAADSTTKKQF
jgi:HK97 gp10 family phage protein